MNKDIIAKIQAGTALTDAEKAEVASFDLQAEINKAASGARKDSEAKLEAAKKAHAVAQAELQSIKDAQQAEADKKKPELERMQSELERLKRTIAEKEKAYTDSQTKISEMNRDQKIGSLSAGIKFVDGLDRSISAMAIKSVFNGIPDAQLDDETIIAPLIAKFRESNKAIIMDTSNGGRNTSPRTGSDTTVTASETSGSFTRSQIKAMSMADYEKNKAAITAAASAGTIKDA